MSRFFVGAFSGWRGPFCSRGWHADGLSGPRPYPMSDDPGLKLVTAVTASVVLALLLLVLAWQPPRPARAAPVPAVIAEAAPTVSAFGLGELTITRAADRLSLAGRVPDAATRELLVEAARRVHPELAVVADALATDPSAPRLHWQDGLLGLLARLRTLPAYTLMLGTPIRIETTLSSDQGRAGWVDYLSRFATGEVLPVDSTGIAIDPLAMMLPTDPDLLFVWRPDYAPGSSALPPAAQAELATITELLRREPGLVRIIGHTEELGDPGADKSLSGERAESIRTILRRAGLPAERLVSMGRGRDVPLLAATEPDAARVNRRIEFAR